MKSCILIIGLVLAFAVFAVGQQTPATETQPNGAAAQAPPPKGTTVTQRQTDTLVQPAPKPVKVTPQMVSAAQAELDKRGYDSGPADGVIGPRTREAVTKFQADQGLTQSGELDAITLEKLNVGGVQTLGAAPADMGRGGKAFGHNIRQGHPVAAAKGLGSGAKSSAKKVAKGSKSLAKEGAEKVGSGLSKIGQKIEGKAEGEKNPPQPSTQNPPPPSSNNPPPK